MSKPVKKTEGNKPKGNPNLKAGPGRPAGLPNKATANAREAIGRLIDGNAERLQGWLDQIEDEQGPKAALACFIDLIEYHVPKLARTEVTGKDGDAIKTQTTLIVNGIEPK